VNVLTRLKLIYFGRQGGSYAELWKRQQQQRENPNAVSEGTPQPSPAGALR